MIKQVLSNGWKLRQAESLAELETSVPGSVFSTYMEHGRMEDPYWRDNEEKALKLMDMDYEYSILFRGEEVLFESEEILLVFEGIDTLSDLYLNDIWLGHTDNMHRTWEYSVKEILKREGENYLKVVLHTPLPYIQEAYRQCECDGSPECSKGFPHLRKAHSMLGWDWGPRLPDMGIWRAVTLLGVLGGRLSDVYITQNHSSDQVLLGIQTKIAKHLSYDVRILSPKGNIMEVTGSPNEIIIEDPMLWWPNGYGEQYLYEIEVILKEEEKVLDSWKKKIGLRTMGISKDKDQWGEEFAHIVNGTKIFAMGGDYIPEDCILSRITKERTEKLLTQCAASNFNVIRVWGGGFYPADYFYDLCDELGLIVWQDFMFACGLYDLNKDMEKNITEELKDNIKRIRHHASLGLWCGNNEMEMFISDGQWIKRKKQKADYLIINQYIIPKLVDEYDPATFYWPSSPSSGGSFDIPNDENRGDAHYWEVWHGGVPFTDYRKYYFRYLSEFGFQSFPSLKTIESFTLPEDRNVFSYIMEKHQRNNAANGKILHYLSQMYLYPNSFSLLVYTSQLLQAEAIKYGVEHMRRNRGRCMGTVYWQINDCWPVASWSSIDYAGRWKALHYYAKRFFAPLLLSCEEEGTLTQSTNVNEENRYRSGQAKLCVTNETRKIQQVLIKWYLRDSYSNILEMGCYETEIEALSSKYFDKMQFSELCFSNEYLSYELWQEELVSEGITLFEVPKHFAFADPELSIDFQGEEIIVTAKAMAKGIEIGNGDGTLLLSDNFFDMNKGEKRVKVLEGSMDNLWVRSVYDISQTE